MPVHYDVDGAVATLVIDRPERRNAIDGPTADALQRHFEAFATDDAVRVLVISGAGDEAFCAGADLKAFESLAHRAGSPAGFEGFGLPLDEGLAVEARVHNLTPSRAERPPR